MGRKCQFRPMGMLAFCPLTTQPRMTAVRSPFLGRMLRRVRHPSYAPVVTCGPYRCAVWAVGPIPHDGACRITRVCACLGMGVLDTLFSSQWPCEWPHCAVRGHLSTRSRSTRGVNSRARPSVRASYSLPLSPDGGEGPGRGRDLRPSPLGYP